MTVALCTALASTAQYDPTDFGILPGDVLVMLQPGASALSIERDLGLLDGRTTDLRVVEEVSAPMRTWLLHFDPAVVQQSDMLKAVQRHPAVMIAQNNHQAYQRVVPNDASFGSQWHHVQSADHDIDTDLAWNTTTGGTSALGDVIVVCQVEGGNLAHTDLSANAWSNAAEIDNNSIDDDGNGYVDDKFGWDPSSGTDNNIFSSGHGTQCAGMIGARGNNSVGVAGANWNVKIMPVTVGSLTEANVIASYTYPLIMRRRYNASNGTQGAFVVATNSSWGIDNANPANYPLWCNFYDTLGTAGILSCGATANNSVNVDVVGDMPTACSSQYLISVTATDNADQRTFSAYGATTIDVGAPGSSVWTTSGSSSYGAASGTSFASPLTAGVIALLYSAPCTGLAQLAKSNPSAAALAVRTALFQGVDHVGNLPGNTVTGGRINANNSLQYIITNCATYSPAVQLTLGAWLEAAYETGTNLMRDDLRSAGLIPTAEPYTALGFANVAGGGGETTTTGVLAVTGNNAIVDWVRVELRSSTTPSSVVATRNGLVQRDGDIVSASDGTSPLSIPVSAGNYYVAVRHRNHLGCMTSTAQALSTSPLAVDFRSSTTATYGTSARKTVGSAMTLWMGNVVIDPNLRYTGSLNDRDPILVRVGSTTPNNSVSGYYAEDCTLDGQVKYTGTGNDRDPIIVNVGGSTPNNVRVEQLP